MRARRALAIAGLVWLPACGGQEDHVNRERPAASVNVTAAIIDGRILVSPRRIGAGPLRLIVTNQTRTAQAVTLATDEVGGDNAGQTATAARIDPSATGTLELDARPGEYAVSTADDAIERATVRIGAPRPSAQNELAQP